MASWRELFGFSIDDRPAYGLVHDRYRDLLESNIDDQRMLSGFGRALEDARKELLPLHRKDESVHTEQLLPP